VVNNGGDHPGAQVKSQVVVVQEVPFECTPKYRMIFIPLAIYAKVQALARQRGNGPHRQERVI